MDLPNELRLGLERELRGQEAQALARVAAALSARYRGEPSGPLLRSPAEVTAYAATRMPATFAATAAAMGALAVLLPSLQPRSQLDVGAGTGAALWAAALTWPSLAQLTALERDQHMAALGQRLAAGARRGGLAGTTWRPADLAGGWDAPPHDLVTATYLLGELPAATQAALVGKLWQRTTGALLLVEPGTPRGWTAIRAAREQLRAAGAIIVAPCPHQGACPMPADPNADWCHFAQRLARSQAHRAAKGGALGYEDEKYSYIAVAREAGAPIEARVLRHPLARPGHIKLTLCAQSGLCETTITRSAGARWREARQLRWGDALLPEQEA